MSQEDFRAKWSAIRAGGREMNLEEKSIYVERGDVPRTQRQLSLYWCFRFIRAHLERIDARSVIEIGCGRGTIGLYCRDYLGLDVTLLDSEEEAIQIAREAFEAHGLDATFAVDDALHTDLPDGAFDATLSIGLAEHLDNVEELFAEQLRILRRGGLMISLNIPKKLSVQHLNYAMRMIKKPLRLYTDRIFKDYYRNAYTAEEYARFARNVGFASAEVTHVCPFPIFVPIRRSTDRTITTVQRGILRLRGLVMPYPYQVNRLIAKEHFLVARKPG
jgi:SAM-dependent methyltransferase